MEIKLRSLSADNARQYYQLELIINSLKETNRTLASLVNKLDNANFNREQLLNEMNNNFNKRCELFLKKSTNILYNKGFIKESHFEKVKSICDKIIEGDKISEKDKKILKESRK